MTGADNVVGSSAMGARRGGNQLGPTSQCASKNTTTSPEYRESLLLLRGCLMVEIATLSWVGIQYIKQVFRESESESAPPEEQSTGS